MEAKQLFVLWETVSESLPSVQVEGKEQGTRESIADGDRCEDNDVGVGARRFWHPVVKLEV